jgi:hypothetical protein
MMDFLNIDPSSKMKKGLGKVVQCLNSAEEAKENRGKRRMSASYTAEQVGKPMEMMNKSKGRKTRGSTGEEEVRTCGQRR